MLVHSSFWKWLVNVNVFLLIIYISFAYIYNASRLLQFYFRFRRAVHVTPKSYLSFICMYKKIYSDKREEIGDAAARMTSGLDKLQEASEAVERLKEELLVMERDLAVASQRAEEVFIILIN